jgi:copper transport protein
MQPAASLAPTLRRFSALAVPLVALLLLSGAALAVVQVRHPSALLDTGYGRLLSVKLVAVVLLLLLAALNRLRLTPEIEQGSPSAPARLRRSVTTEIALGLLIVVLASGFRLTPPPRAIAAAPTEAHAHLHGPTVMADVTLAPGRAGANAVEIGIVGTDGARVDPLEVRISFADPARGLEPISLDAVRDGEVWKAGPVTLPYDGDWTVRLDVLVSDFDKATLEATVKLGGP